MIKASIYQRRFWIDWTLDKKSSKYNEPLFFHIIGKLDINALCESLIAIAKIHPFLRVKFEYTDGKLKTKSVENFECPLIIQKIAENNRKNIENLALNFMSIPFDLEQSIAWRAKIFELDENESWLLISFHHIIIDGYSFDIFRKDFERLYNDNIYRNKILIEKSQSFDDDFFEKEEALLCNTLSNDKENYCRLFKEANLNVELNNTTKKTSTFLFSIGNEIFDKIQMFCQINNVTLFRFVSLCYAIFLYKYFQINKFAIAYPINIRTENEEYILAALINVHLQYLNITKDKNISEVLNQITLSRQLAKKCHDPYEEILEEIKNIKNSPTLELPNIILSETDLRINPLNLNGLKISAISLPKINLPYDVMLEYQVFNNVLHFKFSINDAEFEGKSYRNQLKRHFETIFKKISNNLLEKISDIKLVDIRQTKKWLGTQPLIRYTILKEIE